VVEYGDNFTELTFQQQRQYTFVLVKPKARGFHTFVLFRSQLVSTRAAAVA